MIQLYQINQIISRRCLSRAPLPTGRSESVVSEEVEWGLIDHDEITDEVVGLEIWAASKRLPKAVLEALPLPGRHHVAA